MADVQPGDPGPRWTSHHYSWEPDEAYRYSTSNLRYVWPAECDLMAQLAGLEPAGRWADWARSEFTSESDSYISACRLSA